MECFSAISKSFFIESLFFSGNLLKYSPALTPNMEIPFINGIFIGILGIFPAENPIIRYFPPHFMHLRALLKYSPPASDDLTPQGSEPSPLCAKPDFLLRTKQQLKLIVKWRLKL